MAKYVPLKASFMLFSIIGFFVSILYVPEFSKTWAFAFALLFSLMFIASLLSMTRFVEKKV
ncbi:hypothetical protein DRJ22_00130 [Candidatus Woesearchaeota archaeon]|nr:MAG: hypothetical protein DRJ22_00130 [Candidatus Woesearchaeota archaeon]